MHTFWVLHQTLQECVTKSSRTITKSSRTQVDVSSVISRKTNTCLCLLTRVPTVDLCDKLVWMKTFLKEFVLRNGKSVTLDRRLNCCTVALFFLIHWQLWLPIECFSLAVPTPLFLSGLHRVVFSPLGNEADGGQALPEPSFALERLMGWQ